MSDLYNNPTQNRELVIDIGNWLRTKRHKYGIQAQYHHHLNQAIKQPSPLSSLPPNSNLPTKPDTETQNHRKMKNDNNKDGKHDKHAQREALRSLGASNHLLTGALHGRRGTPDTRSRASHRSAAGPSLLPPILPTVPSTRADGQATQSHRSQSQRSQSSRAQEQHGSYIRRREREERQRNQSSRARQPSRGQPSSSQLHRQSSSHITGLSAGAGPSTLRRQSSHHTAAGSSGAGPSNSQRPQGILRQDSRPRNEPRPEDRFIREGGRGFRCILCRDRDQSYISMQFCRKHVHQKHANALPNRDRPIRVYNCPLCDFVSHEKKGVTLHMTRKHNRKDG